MLPFPRELSCLQLSPPPPLLPPLSLDIWHAHEGVSRRCPEAASYMYLKSVSELIYERECEEEETLKWNGVGYCALM